MSGCFHPNLQGIPAEPLNAVSFEEIGEALDFDDYERTSNRLLRRLDSKNSVVSIPIERAALGSERSAMRWELAWFKDQVSRIPIMDRQEELRFMMGVEFLWRRLKKARRACGFSKVEVEKYPGVDDERCLSCPAGREEFCFGCAPKELSSEKRARLRARTNEFVSARNELMERNLHIVFRLLDRYSRVGVPVQDMVQEANYSLFKAVQGFDFTRGFRFKTYATYWVNQAFLNAIYNQSRTVRVPAYIQKAMKKMRDAVTRDGDDRLFFDIPELAKEAGVTEDLARTAIRGNRYTQSIHKVVDFEDGSELLELFEGKDEASEADFAEDHMLVNRLHAAFDCLNEREQQVLSMRFGFGFEQAQTLAQVGDALGLSLERVRQIQKGALAKLKTGPYGSLLAQYV